jgi:DNA-binding beta-propeller fold protein YncE
MPDLRISRNRWAAGAVALVLLIPAVAIRTAADKRKKGQQRKALQLVWPLPPAEPRIKYIESIHGAMDVEPAKKANFLDRLAGIRVKDFKPGFVKPYGIAVDSHGRIYVADSGQGIIFVLDRQQKQVTFLGRTPQVRLRVPIGIVVDGKDRVWVADSLGQHVYAFDPDSGQVLFALGKPGEMVNPTDVAVDDARNRLYVIDSRQHCVLVYDSESGQYLSKFGKRGIGKGEFNFPTNIALDRAGRIYISDTLNHRVQIFDPEGKFVDTFGEQGNHLGDMLKPKGVALDRDQNIYVVDADFDNFQIFDQKKQLLMFLGSYGQEPGTFWLPAGICIDQQNFIYVADQNNRRIQIFQLLNGKTNDGGAPKASAAPSQVPTHSSKGGGPEHTGDRGL